MPGLEDLEAGAKEMLIRYSDLLDGAKVEYESSDPALATAQHDWFDAQISDHGDYTDNGDSAADGRSPTTKGTMTSNTT